MSFFIQQLKNAVVESFEVHDVDTSDTIIRFDFTLYTDHGRIYGDIVEVLNFGDDDFCKTLLAVFMPGFGEILKKALIAQLKSYVGDCIENEYEYYSGVFYCSKATLRGKEHSKTTCSREALYGKKYCEKHSKHPLSVDSRDKTDKYLNIINNPPDAVIDKNLLYFNKVCESNDLTGTSRTDMKWALIEYLREKSKGNLQDMDVVMVCESNWEKTAFTDTAPRDCILSILEDAGKITRKKIVVCCAKSKNKPCFRRALDGKKTCAYHTPDSEDEMTQEQFDAEFLTGQ